MKKLIAIFLIALTVLQCLPMTALAAGLTQITPTAPAKAAAPTPTKTAEAPQPNIWYGDEIQFNVAAGSGSYKFVSYYKTPRAGYEASNHMVHPRGVEGGQEIPQLLVLLDASRDYTWTPDGLYSFGASNYEVMYCCDIKTMYHNNTYYRRLNLEDSNYYDADSAARIRGILTNSYPYISMEQMKSNLIAAGLPGAEKLTRSDLIAGVQTAIWAYANGGEDAIYTDYVYYRTADFPSNPQWGGILHNYNNEMRPLWWPEKKYAVIYPHESEEAKAAGERVDALVAHLKSVEPREISEDQVIISGIEILDSVPVFAQENVYTAVVRVKLNSSGSSPEDRISVGIYVDGQPVQTEQVEFGNTVYEFTVRVAAGQTIKAIASGTQILPTGVYYYEAMGGRDASQSLVGLSGGPTDVHAEAEITLNVEPDPVKADIRLEKVSADGTPLAGAGFDLYLSSATEPTLIGSFAVDAEGVLLIEGLLPGSYELTETVVPGGYLSLPAPIAFTVDAEGNVILAENSHASFAEGVLTVRNDPDIVSVEGTKTWNDADNQDGIRPESVTVHLLANGTAADTVTVTAADGWKWSFTNLPRCDAEGNPIAYTVSEDPVPGYTAEVNGFDIVNTHEPEKTDISVRKSWGEDSGSTLTKRPASVTVHLLADGERTGEYAVLSAENRWTAVFGDLDCYRAGKKIVYTVEEDVPEGYTAFITGSAETGFTVTNVPSIERMNIPVTKLWHDDDNAAGARPASVTVALYANGKDTNQRVTLSDENGWTAEFTSLPVKENGTAIRYAVYELPVDDYAPSISGSASGGFVIVNTYIPQITSISGEKIWNDGDNRDGIRPSAITVYLMANGVPVQTRTVTAADNWSYSFDNLPLYVMGDEIVYTVAEAPVPGYTAARDGYNLINTHVPETTSVPVQKLWADGDDQDGLRPASVSIALLADGEDSGKRITLTAENGWAGEFTDLPVYKAGKKILYTVEEAVPAGYTVSVTGTADGGFTVKNSYLPETTSVSVQKVWADSDDQDGLRPASVVIALLADGEDTGKTVTLSAKNGWTGAFTDLPVYKNGEKILYTVEEAVPAGYTVSVTGTADGGFTVTNTHIPAKRVTKISVSVGKIWQDAANQDGIRPASVTVKLFADGRDTGRTAQLTAAGGWKAAFTDLDETKDGRKIVYTVEEIVPEGYTSDVTGNAADGFRITNTHVPEKIRISGMKIWNDSDNRSGKRPDSVTVRLWADDTEIGSATVTAADGWSWSFGELDACKDGKRIRYRITEDPVEGYFATYSGWNVVNTSEDEELTRVPVAKYWDDLDDALGTRPASVTVELFADGVSTGLTLTLDGAGGWASAFENLPVYTVDGEKIAYTVTEHPVLNYTAEISGSAADGFAILNTYEEELPEEEVPLSPPTGGSMMIPVLVAVLSAGAYKCFSRRKKDEESDGE